MLAGRRASMAETNPKGTTYSTFGPQSLGGHESQPSFGFGTNSREKQGNVFISQEHMAIQCAGKCSPGPASYLLPQAIGPQPDSRKSRGPTFGFGTSLRFRIRDKEAKTDGRFGNNPSPAHYDPPPASVGPQVLGRFRSEPRMGFGTAERKHVKKVWISQAHQKTDMHGMGSPGPATYALKSTMGKQDESVIPNPPTWVFGSAKRTDVEPGECSTAVRRPAGRLAQATSGHARVRGVDARHPRQDLHWRGAGQERLWQALAGPCGQLPPACRGRQTGANGDLMTSDDGAADDL